MVGIEDIAESGEPNCDHRIVSCMIEYLPVMTTASTDSLNTNADLYYISFGANSTVKDNPPLEKKCRSLLPFFFLIRNPLIIYATDLRRGSLVPKSGRRRVDDAYWGLFSRTTIATGRKTVYHLSAARGSVGRRVRQREYAGAVPQSACPPIASSRSASTVRRLSSIRQNPAVRLSSKFECRPCSNLAAIRVTTPPFDYLRLII